MKQMLYRIFVCACMSLIACISARSQTAVDAELAFAKAASDYSMKIAFLRYADSNGVVFAKGRVLNAIETWNKSADQPGLLAWHPLFTGVSSSEDLAFNTGPFTFRASANDSLSGAGLFATVWTKNHAGQWKFLVDLGVECHELFAQPTMLSHANDLTTDNEMMDIDSIESEFIRSHALVGNEAYVQYHASQSWFNVDGLPSMTNRSMIETSLSSIPAGVNYEPVMSGMSGARDLAYVYGIAMLNGKKENYLRVWGHTSGGWKILLSVLKK